MEHIWIRLIICTALAVVFYLLWVNGWLVTSWKRAAFFMLSRKKNGCKVRFSACTGTVKRIIRLREERGYAFAFHSALHAGAVMAELQDRRGGTVLRLDGSVPGGSVPAGRYRLVLHFEKADGMCELTWDRGCCEPMI